jgi:hypothetical protein
VYDNLVLPTLSRGALFLFPLLVTIPQDLANPLSDRPRLVPSAIGQGRVVRSGRLKVPLLIGGVESVTVSTAKGDVSKSMLWTSKSKSISNWRLQPARGGDTGFGEFKGLVDGQKCNGIPYDENVGRSVAHS